MTNNTDVRPGKAWMTWVVINGLITFFGTSYLLFPGEAVVKAGYRTEGVVHLPAAVWGAYVVTSALAMLAVTFLGLRRGRRWATLAALYEFLFLFLVVIIEPDPVFPVIFAGILGLTLWRIHANGEMSPATTLG